MKIKDRKIKGFKVLDLCQLDKNNTYLIGVNFNEQHPTAERVLGNLKHFADISKALGYNNLYFYASNCCDISNVEDIKKLIKKVEEDKN